MFWLNLLFGLSTRAGVSDIFTLVVLRTFLDEVGGGASHKPVFIPNHDKKRILIMAQGNAAAQVQPIFGKPAVVPAAGQQAQNRGNANRAGYVPEADFVPAEFYLNTGMGFMIAPAEGEDPVLTFVSLPKGTPFDTMELTDGKSDAFAARNDLHAFMLGMPEVQSLKPGETVFLMPLAEGCVTVQVLRRRDPNAPPSGPSPIRSAVANAFKSRTN